MSISFHRHCLLGFSRNEKVGTRDKTEKVETKKRRELEKIGD
jgi:hypothetical protein